MTIKLEDRYFVIALVVAIRCLEDQFRERYEAESLLESCRVYWTDGFASLTTTDFRLYLDEMVGLGVLVKHPNGRFAVRSPNVVTMLGTRTELLRALEEGADLFVLPHDYNPRVTRRLVDAGGGGTVRSPLTEEDLSGLLPIEETPWGEVTIIVGSQALHLSRTPAVIHAVAGERSITVEDVPVAELAEYESRRAPSRNRNNIALVDATNVKSEDLAAVLMSLTRQAKSASLRSIILVGPNALAQLLSSSNGLKIISLGLWSNEALRAWNENPFDSAQHRANLTTVTGGWPTMLEPIVEQALSGETVERALECAREQLADPNWATIFLSDCGLNPELDLPFLRDWVGLTAVGEEVQQNDLEAISVTLEAGLDAWLERLTHLRVVHDDGDGLKLDPVVY